MPDLTIPQLLSDSYCSRCDSFGHTERKRVGVWCNSCWDWYKPLPNSVVLLLRKLEEKR